jgi:hypothetical protein
MNNLLTGLISSILILGSSASIAQVVTPDDPQGWFATDQAGSGTGTISDTQPRGAGTGSLEFTTSGSTADQVSAGRIPLIRLNDITAVGYDFYSDNGNFAPALKLAYFGATFGTLVYEPGENLPYTTNTWVSRPDVTGGNWWSTENPGGPRQTLAAWQASLGNPLVNFFKVGVGSGWNSATTGYADLVTLNGATWDFEATPAGTLPPGPVPARQVPTMSEWVLMLLALMLGLIVFARRKQLFS